MFSKAPDTVSTRDTGRASNSELRPPALIGKQVQVGDAESKASLAARNTTYPSRSTSLANKSPTTGGVRFPTETALLNINTSVAADPQVNVANSANTGTEPSSFCTDLWEWLCSIRILTALLCAAFIIITAICLLVTTFTFSISAAQDIAEQHAVAIATKAKNDVQGLLSKPLGTIAGWQFSHSKGNFPLPRDMTGYGLTGPAPSKNSSNSQGNDDMWYTRYASDFAGAMKSANFGYQYAVMGFDDGNYVGCLNTPSPQNPTAFSCRIMQWGSRPANGSGLTQTYQEWYERNYSRFKDETGFTTYDPRTRGWYRMVDHKPFAMKWSTVYLSVNPIFPIIDVNAAVFNESGVMLGITSLTFELSQLGDFLQNLATTENTVSVLIDNENLLLASSYHDPYLTRTAVPRPYTGVVPSDCLLSDAANGAAESIILCRAAVSSYSYAPLRELALSEPALVREGAEGARRIRLDETDYFVSVVPITTELAEGMHWRFALFVPQSDIVSGIIRGRDIAIFIAIAIVVVVVGLCFAILTLLLSPLKSVTESMYRLATLQDTEVESTPSRLQEIATIQGAFKVMSEELTKVKSFLPQSVLAQLYGSSSEGEDDDDEGNEAGADPNVSATDESKSALDHLSAAQASELSATVIASGVHNDSSTHTAANDGRTSQLQRHKGRQQNQPTKALNAALSISTRRVTMLAVNIAAYHQHVVGADPSSVMIMSSDVVGAVSSAVIEHKGVLDGFQGDKFMASFNAVTSVGNHRTAAATAALLARTTLSNITVTGGEPLRMTAGVASGPAMVGNMGTQIVKRFTVLGHVVTNAGILERLCKVYRGASVLAEASVTTEAESVCEVLCCDVVNLPCRTSVSDLAFSKDKHQEVAVRPARIFAVVVPKDLSADEWMYSLDHGAKVSRYGVLNDAFGLFLSGDVTGCAAALERFGSLRSEKDTEVLVGGVMRRLKTLVSMSKERATEFGPSYVNPMRDYYSTLIGAHVDEERRMDEVADAFKVKDI